MKNSKNYVWVSLCITLFFTAACSDEETEIFETSSSTDDTTLLKLSTTTKTTVVGDKIIDIDYSSYLDKFIIAVDREDKVTLHYSLTTDSKQSMVRWWTDWSVSSQAVPKGHPDATPFLGSAWDMNGNGIRVLKNADDNYLKVLPGITKNGQPIFRGGTRAYRVGDLAEFMDIDYDPANDIFVMTGKTPAGVAQTYFCRGTTNWDNWEMVPTKYGAGTIESTDVTEYKGAAWGATDGTFVYAYTYEGAEDGLLVLQGRYSDGIPRLESGSRVRVGDLATLVDIDYNTNDKYYAITGLTASGELKTYFSWDTGGKSWKEWTENTSNQNVEKQTHGAYFGSAWSADGHFMTGFIADRNNLPSVTIGNSSNGPRYLPGRASL